MSNEQSGTFLNSRAEILSKAPTLDGVYIFRSGTTIVYIGKSVNIRARLLSHIENAKLDPKEAAIMSSSDTIEYIVADSEFKALMLESHLIQKHKPKYNARWRDDKSYLYIKITIKDEYPKIFAVRRERDGASRYFGPFPSTASVEEILKAIRRIFPFCTQKKISKHQCFYSKIKLCNPCPNVIEHTIDPSKKQRLKKIYRANIRSIIKIFEGNTDSIVTMFRREMDVFTQTQDYENALIIRNKIYQFEHLIHDRALSSDIESIFNQSGERVEDLVKMLRHFFPEFSSAERIECYDISNLSQKEATASMVVFTDGLADKSQYRRFKIKNLKSRSDFEMLDEVLTRRLKNDWPTPDLIVIDGGKPQVTTATHVFQKLNIKIPYIGIAKRPDRFVIGIRDMPTIRPKIQSPAFNLIRSIRDESHRFAKKYHLLLRTKRMNMI